MKFEQFDPLARTRRGQTTPERMKIGEVVTRQGTTKQQRSSLRNQMRKAYQEIGAKYSVALDEETGDYSIRRDA